jgi:4a-hydroxytetrahydrobiopterin dehydratase
MWSRPARAASRPAELYACGVAVLDEATVAQALTHLAWTREGDELVKVSKRDGFAGALAFVNAVGALSEAANHHPDIDIRWDTVTLRLTTHSAGGLTQKDLDLAAAIDALG